MFGEKGGIVTKSETNFALTMLNIYCICHRLALAFSDY